MKKFNTPEIMHHVKSALEQTLSSLFNNEFVIKIVESSLTDDATSPETRQLVLRMTIHVEPRTIPLKVS